MTALFFLGRSQRQTGSLKEAAATFTELTKTKLENNYYDKSWIELAQMDLEAGRGDEARKKFELVARESAEDETKADSMVNAGMIEADAGRGAEAMALFEQALKIPGDRAKAPRARARFGMVWSSFKAKEWQKVITAWTGMKGEDYAGFDEYTRARLWLIVGTSYASSDKHAVAAQTFSLLDGLRQSNNRQVLEVCLEGGYKRIVSLFKLEDKSTPDVVDDFTRTWDERMAESEYLDKARLVKGAYYFNRSIWDAAARAYKGVRAGKLEPEKAATLLYQRGCAEASSGDKDAVSTLSSFLEKNSTDPRAIMAQLQRGLARLKQEDLANALNDFTEISSRAAGTETGETASYHAARVRGMKQDFAGMVSGFQRLLADYPKTQAAAEAHYWIGAGTYKLGNFAECIEPLQTARTMDAKTYFEEAGLMIIGALVAPKEKDLDALVKEVDSYLAVKTVKKISPDILTWLAMTLFKEKKDYIRTASYLTPVVDFGKPENTPVDVWQTYGEALLEIKSYEPAVGALETHLKLETRPAQKARSWLLHGKALLALNRLDDAAKSVDEGLTLDKTTLLAAQLNLLSGDVDTARGNMTSAISSYNLVRLSWEDPRITPTAMSRQAALLKQSQDPEKVKEGEQMEANLKKHYPAFRDTP